MKKNDRLLKIRNCGLLLFLVFNANMLFAGDLEPVSKTTTTVDFRLTQNTAKYFYKSIDRSKVQANYFFYLDSIALTNYLPKIDFKYLGTVGGFETLISFKDFRDQVNAAIGNSLYNDGAGVQGASLIFKTAFAGTIGERMRITPSGDIGIGTNAPDGKLTVKGYLQILDGRLNFNTAGNGNHNSYTHCILAGHSDSDHNYNNVIAFYLSYNPRAQKEIMRMNALGIVGIGTDNLTDDNFKLVVNSGIRAKKIKLETTNWPDYVFEGSYRLKDLKAVEEFVTTNKHLPDIPSAKDIEKNGLDVGENQALLLRKIEELTLYIIKQDKRIAKLEESRPNKK